MKYSNVGKILGGPKVLHKKIEDHYDLIELGEMGVTKNALLMLAKSLDFSLSQMAELLPITERTLQRYSTNKHFNKSLSEHILQISIVVAKGLEVFGSKEKFLLWMNQPNTALSNSIPINLVKSRFGSEMVMDELGRIEYGVIS